jgi:tetratricopeptide (TPR) repeat protein
MVGSGEDTGSLFVGRERELETLTAGLRDARSSRARLLVVTGDAGIGKTRMVEELVRSADLPSGRVLWGRAPEQTGAPSYWPWIRALEGYVSGAESDALREQLGGDGPVLAHLVPGIRSRCPDVQPVPPGGADAEARFRLLDAVTSFIRRAAAQAPLLVILEDLHWADEASLALLAFVAGELRTARLLLVATCREREPQRRPRGLTDALRLGQRVPLRGLGRAAVGALVAARAGTAPAALVGRLHDLTEGNPFYLDEVLRVLRDAGRLDDPDAEGAPVPLPDSVRDTLRRRLDPLDVEDRELLALASVVGREFDVVLLRLATGRSAEEVLARLTAATALGLVEETPTIGRFRFAHALVHETVYGELLPAARARLHQRVAEALEAHHADRADAPLGELAAHYARAAPLGTAAKAVECSVRAAEQAVALYAYGDAMSHYERALAALALLAPDERKRLEICLALGDVAVRAARYPQARQAFDQAARRARTLDDKHAFVFAALSYAEASPPSGAPDAAVIALLEEALAAVGEADSFSRALALAMLGQALYFSDLARSAALSAEALATARRTGDPVALSLALLYRQVVLSGPGDVGERLVLVEEALGVAERIGFEPALHHGQVARVFCLLELGRVGEAAAAIDRMQRDAERTRLPDRQWRALVHRGGLAILDGRFAEAARLAAEALAVRRDASDPTAVRLFTMQTFLCRRETGELGGIESSIRAQVAEYPALGSWQCLLAVLLAETGRHEEARATLDALAPDDFAAIRRDFNYPPSLALLSNVVSVLHDGARAETLYRLLTPFAQRNVVFPVYSPGALGSAHRHLGLLAVTMGDGERAAAHFEAALAMNARMGARPALARTQRDFARLLLARARSGDRERALALRAAGLELAEACGMTRLCAELAEPVQAPPADTAPARAGADEAVAPGGATVEATLHRDVDFWTVVYGADSFQLKDTKGLAFLQTLLRHPNREFHVLDLSGGGEPLVEGSGRAAAGDAGELLDASARAAYKRRLEDLRDEVEEAQRWSDLERAARAQQEIDFLTDELARAVGLGGRSRTAGSAAERARVNVSRTIGAVVKKIAAGSPALGQHLTAAVRTGYFCVYEPDPRVRVDWRF